jgi:hypothetical protein
MYNKDPSRMVVTDSGRKFCEGIIRADIQEQQWKSSHPSQKTTKTNSRYHNNENTIQEYLRTVPQSGPISISGANSSSNGIPKAIKVNSRFFLPKLDKKTVSGLTKSQGNYVNRKLYESHKIVSDYARVTESGSYQDLFRFIKPNKVTSKYSRMT